MSIIINFTNANTEPSVVDIFRADAPISSAALPETPIATLSAGETSYRDDAVVRDAVYHYMTRTTVGSNVFFSPSIRRKNTRSTGPGPDTIIYGDERFGYYGDVFLGEIMPVRLLEEVSFNTQVMYMPKNTYHKMAVDGKILFVPSTDAASMGTSSANPAQGSVQAARWIAMHQTGNDADTEQLQAILRATWGVTPEMAISKLELNYHGYKYLLRLPTIDSVESAFVDRAPTVQIDILRENRGGDLLRLFGSTAVTQSATTAMTNNILRSDERRGVSLPPPVTFAQNATHVCGKFNTPGLRSIAFGMNSTNAGMASANVGTSIASSTRTTPIIELIESN